MQVTGTSPRGVSSRRRARFAAHVGAFLAFFVVLMTMASAHAQTVVGGGLGIFFEKGDVMRSQRTSLLTEDQDFSYARTNPWTGSIYALVGISERFRAGGGLVWYGKQVLDREDGEEDYELGSQLDFTGLADYRFPITDRIDALVGVHAAMSMLFISGDLQDDVDRQAQFGASVSDGPRLGVHAGPLVGARYELLEKLHVRADLRIGWQRMWLMNVSERIDDFPYERKIRLSSTRYTLHVGFEIPF